MIRWPWRLRRVPAQEGKASLVAQVRSLISSLAAFAIAAGQIAPAAAAPLSKADYEACQARDETGAQGRHPGHLRARAEDRHRQRRLPRRGRRRLAPRRPRRHRRQAGRPRRRRGGAGDELGQSVAVARLPAEGAGARHRGGRARLPLRRHEGGAGAARHRRRQGHRPPDRAGECRCQRADARLPQGLRRRPLRHHGRPRRQRRDGQGPHRRSRARPPPASRPARCCANRAAASPAPPS